MCLYILPDAYSATLKNIFSNQYNPHTNARQFTQMLFGFLVNVFSTKLIDKSYILWYYKDKEKYVNAVKEVKP